MPDITHLLVFVIRIDSEPRHEGTNGSEDCIGGRVFDQTVANGYDMVGAFAIDSADHFAAEVPAKNRLDFGTVPGRVFHSYDRGNPAKSTKHLLHEIHLIFQLFGIGILHQLATATLPRKGTLFVLSHTGTVPTKELFVNCLSCAPLV